MNFLEPPDFGAEFDILVKITGILRKNVYNHL